MAVNGFAVVAPTLQQPLFFTTPEATGTCFSHEAAMSWPGVKQLYVRNCANKRAKTGGADLSYSWAMEFNGEAKAVSTSRSSTCGLPAIASDVKQQSNTDTPELTVAGVFPSHAPAQRTLSAPVSASFMLLATDNAFAPGTPPMLQLPAHPSSPGSPPLAPLPSLSALMQRRDASPEDVMMSHSPPPHVDPHGTLSSLAVGPSSANGLLSAAFRRCPGGSSLGQATVRATDGDEATSSPECASASPSPSPSRLSPSTPPPLVALSRSTRADPAAPRSGDKAVMDGGGGVDAAAAPASRQDDAGEVDGAASAAGSTARALLQDSLPDAAAAATAVAAATGAGMAAPLPLPAPAGAAATRGAPAVDTTTAVVAGAPSLSAAAEAASVSDWRGAAMAMAEPLLLPYDLSRSVLWRVGEPRGKPPLPRPRRAADRRLSLTPTISSERQHTSSVSAAVEAPGSGDAVAASDKLSTPPCTLHRATCRQAHCPPPPPPPPPPSCSQPMPTRASSLRGGTSPFGRQSGFGVPLGWSAFGGGGAAVGAAAATSPKGSDLNPDPSTQPVMAAAVLPVCWGGAQWTRQTSPFAMLAEQAAVPYGDDECDENMSAEYGGGGRDGHGAPAVASAPVPPRPPSPRPAPAPSHVDAMVRDAPDGGGGGAAAAAAEAAMDDDELDDYYLNTLCGGCDPLVAFLQHERERSQGEEGEREGEPELRDWSRGLPTTPTSMSTEVEAELVAPAGPASVQVARIARGVARGEAAAVEPTPPPPPPPPPPVSILRMDTTAIALPDYGTLTAAVAAAVAAAPAAPPPRPELAAAAAATATMMQWEAAEGIDVYGNDDDLFFELSIADDDGVLQEAAAPQRQWMVVTAARCDMHSSQVHTSLETRVRRQMERLTHMTTSANPAAPSADCRHGVVGGGGDAGVVPDQRLGAGASLLTEAGWRRQLLTATAVAADGYTGAGEPRDGDGGGGGGGPLVVVELDRVESCVHCSVAVDVRRMVDRVVSVTLGLSGGSGAASAVAAEAPPPAAARPPAEAPLL